jgi:hypothetical protein
VHTVPVSFTTLIDTDNGIFGHIYEGRTYSFVLSNCEVAGSTFHLGRAVVKVWSRWHGGEANAKWQGWQRVVAMKLGTTQGLYTRALKNMQVGQLGQLGQHR